MTSGSWAALTKGLPSCVCLLVPNCFLMQLKLLFFLNPTNLRLPGAGQYSSMDLPERIERLQDFEFSFHFLKWMVKFVHAMKTLWDAASAGKLTFCFLGEAVAGYYYAVSARNLTIFSPVYSSSLNPHALSYSAWKQRAQILHFDGGKIIIKEKKSLFGCRLVPRGCRPEWRVNKPPRVTWSFVSKVRGVLCAGRGTEDMAE